MSHNSYKEFLKDEEGKTMAKHDLL